MTDHAALETEISRLTFAVEASVKEQTATRLEVVKITAAVGTIADRGCEKGEEMMKEAHKRIDAQQRLMILVGSLSAAVGAIAGYLVK